MAKRNLLASALEAAGIVPMRGEGGFFLIGDTSALQVRPHSALYAILKLRSPRHGVALLCVQAQPPTSAAAPWHRVSHRHGASWHVP